MTQAIFSSLGASMRANVELFFTHAGSYLHTTDTAGHGGDLAAGWNWEREQRVQQSFATALTQVRRADTAASAGNTAEALRQWRMVFGDEFPAYG